MRTKIDIENPVSAMTTDSSNKILIAEGNRAVLHNTDKLNPYKIFNGHKYDVTSIDIKNGIILTGSRTDRTVRTYNENKGFCMMELKVDSPIYSLALDPNSKFLIVGLQNGSAVLQRLFGGKKVKEYREHFGPITTISFSKCGNQFQTGSTDGQVKFWDIENQYSINTFDVKNHENNFNRYDKNIKHHVYMDSFQMFIATNDGLVHRYPLDNSLDQLSYKQQTSFNSDELTEPTSLQVDEIVGIILVSQRNGKTILFNQDGDIIHQIDGDDEQLTSKIIEDSNLQRGLLEDLDVDFDVDQFIKNRKLVQSDKYQINRGSRMNNSNNSKSVKNHNYLPANSRI